MRRDSKTRVSGFQERARGGLPNRPDGRRKLVL